jgi:hypothetical protein
MRSAGIACRAPSSPPSPAALHRMQRLAVGRAGWAPRGSSAPVILLVMGQLLRPALLSEPCRQQGQRARSAQCGVLSITARDRALLC